MHYIGIISHVYSLTVLKYTLYSMLELLRWLGGGVNPPPVQFLTQPVMVLSETLGGQF